MLNGITPLILTFNEAANIERTLAALSWAKQIVVVDSFSTDATPTICAQQSNVTLVQRAFDQHAAQWNYGLAQLDAHGWTLALDADHIVTDAFVAEISHYFAAPAENLLAVEGFRNGFVYCQDGKPLHGSLYPPLVALFRTAHGHYIQEGHTQRLQLTGKIVDLQSRNLHDDRKSLARWQQSQRRYADLDAEKLAMRPWHTLRWTDRARVIPFISPVLVLIYTLIIRGLVLNGPAGIKYSMLRTWAECLLHIARCKRWLKRLKRA